MAKDESGDRLTRVVNDVWQAVREIEPARGKVTADQVLAIRGLLENLVTERAQHDLVTAGAEAAAELDGAVATIHARAAAVAIAAGDEANAERWLVAAEKLSRDDDQRAELAAARRSHERYRTLVQGRSLIATQRESAARALWTELTKGESDALARAAADELKAPRALGPRDSTPTLFRFNGIGVGFYGSRDRWSDGSYATTHCFSVLWVPLIALSAWRVRDADGGYQILAREQLSSFARRSRWFALAGIALAITGVAISSYLGDPDRLAEQRFEEALEVAQHVGAEDALHRLDAELTRDVLHVDRARAERAGAEVVRLTASYVTPPVTIDNVDQAIRVVRRYQALPERARAGAAEDALFALVDIWTRQLDTQGSGAAAEAQLALASAAYEAAPLDRKAGLEAHVVSARLALAAGKQADWPLDALATLVGPGGTLEDRSAIDAADKIIARLVDSPSLLLDAGADLDAWLAATSARELRTRITELRATAADGRKAAEADGATSQQLTAMQVQRPWDQYVAVQLAQNDAGAGKLDEAAARLSTLGPPGMTVRIARFMLAQLAASQGKLEDANAQLTSLLGTRVQRFAAASAAVRDAAKAAQDRIEGALRSGNVPADFKRRYEAANASERDDVVSHWVDEQMAGDTALIRARERYVALGDVVPMALAAGSIKLRRAQSLSGPARDRMLQDAERTFLAIRTEAEGQPSFRLGLGEIYARLGKTAESEAEFAAVLAQHDLTLDVNVARVYRNIGSVARAKEIAKQAYTKARSPMQEGIAEFLAVMSNADEDEAEGWYRKADQKAPGVRSALLALEGQRFARAGKTAECAAKFAAAAKIELGLSDGVRRDGHNNAALYYEHGFNCSSDPQALRDAETALETAYRNTPENPIVVGNLIQVLTGRGELRVLARHIDARGLGLRLGDVTEVIDDLLNGSERTTLVTELTADPSIRRGTELLAQLEVLMPNGPRPYLLRFKDAVLKRDVDAAAAIVERVRGAKALEVSETTAERERRHSGADDAKWLADFESTQTRLETVLARPGADRLDAKTRAVGWYLRARALARIGLYKPDKVALARAREAAATALNLWSALDSESLIVVVLIDQAGIDGNAKAWLASRRTRGAVAALDQLAARHDPLATQVLAGKSWADVARHVKLDPAHPELANLRLARLLGDRTIEARAKAVLDDKLVRLELEFAVLNDPSDEAAKQDLAYLDAR